MTSMQNLRNQGEPFFSIIPNLLVGIFLDPVLNNVGYNHTGGLTTKTGNANSWLWQGMNYYDKKWIPRRVESCDGWNKPGDCKWLFSQNSLKERNAEDQMNSDLNNTASINNTIDIDYSKLLSWSVLANKPDTGMYEFFTKPISPVQIEIRYKASLKIPDTGRVHRTERINAKEAVGLPEDMYSFDKQKGSHILQVHPWKKDIDLWSSSKSIFEMYQGQLHKDFQSILDVAKLSTTYYSNSEHLYVWMENHIKYLPSGLMTVEYNYICFDPDMAVGDSHNMWLSYFI
jgi:hypothetical protein